METAFPWAAFDPETEMTDSRFAAVIGPITLAVSG
jgi:hypothetical protein